MKLRRYYVLAISALCCVFTGCKTTPERPLPPAFPAELEQPRGSILRKDVKSYGPKVMQAKGWVELADLPPGHQVWLVVEKILPNGEHRVWPKENFLADNNGYLVPDSRVDKQGRNPWKARFSEPYGNTPKGSLYHLALFVASADQHDWIITWINEHEGLKSYPGIQKELFKGKRIFSMPLYR